MKAASGKLSVADGYDEFVRLVESFDFQRLPITDAHLRAYLKLPYYPEHKDSFDRMLISQAQAEGLTFISRDANMKRYEVNLLW